MPPLSSSSLSLVLCWSFCWRFELNLSELEHVGRNRPFFPHNCTLIVPDFTSYSSILRCCSTEPVLTRLVSVLVSVIISSFEGRSILPDVVRLLGFEAPTLVGQEPTLVRLSP